MYDDFASNGDYSSQMELFPFANVREQLLFQKLVNKISFKSEEGKLASYMKKSLQYFEEVTSEELVNDKCVGCNQFFYRFHLIDPSRDSKLVPVDFLYTFPRYEEELYEKEEVKYPPEK